MKKRMITIIIICVIALTGCMQNNNLTEHESDIVGEYMAGLLLNNEEKYQAALLTPDFFAMSAEEIEPITPTTVVTPTPISVQDGVVKTKDQIKAIRNSNMSEVIGTKDFDIQYMGYQLAETYPEDTANTYFSLTPRNGNQLLVALFSVENITKEEKRLDLSSLKINYQLDINIGTIYKPLLTLLEHDLQYIDVRIKEGNTEKVLLIFEVNNKVDISNINLIISKDNKTEIIDIK